MANNNTKESEESIMRGRALISRLEQIQYDYFNGRPVWTNIELKNLKLFMAYVYYGYPNFADIDENLNIDIIDLYEDDKKKRLKEMVLIIQEKYKIKSNEIEVGFTMIHSICSDKCGDCQNFPSQDIHTYYLLRIRLNSEVVYIDFTMKRIYKNWNDYIKENKLPKGYMFYPESGVYEERNYLNFAPTPMSSKSNICFNFIDRIGRTVNFATGLLLLGSFINPMFTTVALGAAVVSMTTSAYESSRQIVALTDQYQHGQSLTDREAMISWLNLSISIIGIMTAPAVTFLKEMKFGKSMLSFGTPQAEKTLSVICKSACITQCSLEVVRCVLQITNDGKVSVQNLLSLRLDLFFVVGKLLPLGKIRILIEAAYTAVLSPRIYSTIVGFGYCLSRYLMAGVCFIKEHVAMFAERLIMYLNKELTPSKLLSAWRTYRDVIQQYLQRSEALTGDELILDAMRSVPLQCHDPDAAMRALCGPEMKGLLVRLEATGDRRAIAFYAGRVMRRACELEALRREVSAEMLGRGIDDTAQVDAEFCKQLGLDAGCGTEQYVLRAVRDVEASAADLANEYREHSDRPENVHEGLQVAGHENGAYSLSTYTMQPPAGDLDAATCSDFARVVDPRNRGKHDDYKYAVPEPNTAVLYSVSAFSLRMVLFSVDSRSGRPSSLNVSVFRDSRNSSGCRMLNW